MKFGKRSKFGKHRKSAIILAVILVLTLLLSFAGITTLYGRKASSAKTNPIDANKKSNNIKVSVIVPVYKTEKYLKECIDSIRNQTLKDIEIICVDDGSPDNCGKMLDEYAKEDNRIKVIHQKNADVSAARNAGINKATGEYLKFVDSDDTIDEKACEVCYSKAKEQDADILLHDAGKEETLKTPVFDLLTPSSCFGVYKRALINRENVKFKTDLKFAEDQTFNLMCFPKANKIVTIKEHFYNYRPNPTSACHTPKVEIHSKSHASAVNYVYNCWKENGYFKDNDVKVKFLRWAWGNNYWRTEEINKMFIKAIGPELLNESTLRLLDKATREEFEKAIRIAEQKKAA